MPMHIAGDTIWSDLVMLCVQIRVSVTIILNFGKAVADDVLRLAQLLLKSVNTCSRRLSFMVLQQS